MIGNRWIDLFAWSDEMPDPYPGQQEHQAQNYDGINLGGSEPAPEETEQAE